MAVLTSKDYVERLKKQKVNGYMAGEKIGNIVDDKETKS